MGEFKGRDAAKLVQRIRDVGRLLVSAQPREVVVGNIVRRVLGLVREVVDENMDSDTNATNDTEAGSQLDSSPRRPLLSSSISTFSPLHHAVAEPLQSSFHSEATSDSIDLSKRPPLTASHTTSLGHSLFGLFSQPETPSASNTPTGQQSPTGKAGLTTLNLERLADFSKSNLSVDLKAEVQDGIKELQDELEQSDELIAANALDHIHSNEIILTHTASTSVQKFSSCSGEEAKVHGSARRDASTRSYCDIWNGTDRKEEGAHVQR